MYGVAGALFCGESMLSRAENASKNRAAGILPTLRTAAVSSIDCQVLNNHATASLGAVDIPRRDYLDYLSRITRLPTARAILSAAGAISWWIIKCFQHILRQDGIIAR